jgi:hypothetical protein
MAILPVSGRTGLAVAIMAQPLHMGWGIGEPDWDSDKAGAFPFQDDTIALAPPAGAPVSAVVVTSVGGATTFSAGTDYSVDAAGGIITREPAGLISPGATVNVAWHIGRPAEDKAATALRAEVGRRLVVAKQFVVPDAAGVIEVPEGRFSPSATPTNHIHVLCRFGYGDAPNAVIRELGVFLGTTILPTVPEGEVYLLPQDVAAPGWLMALQHVAPLFRSPDVRQSFEFVLTL